MGEELNSATVTSTSRRALTTDCTRTLDRCLPSLSLRSLQSSAGEAGRYEGKVKEYLAIFCMCFVPAVSADSLSVHGVTLDMMVDDVVSEFGEPKKIEEIMDWYDYRHAFDEFVLHANSNGSIVGIESHNEGVCLGDGICVGDDWREIEIQKSEYQECCERVYPAYDYWRQSDYCRYLLAIEGESVSSIAAFCSP